MTSKKNQVKKVVTSKKATLTTGRGTKQIVASNKTIDSDDLTEVMSKRVRVHWAVIQKDFKLLADDMSYCLKDVKEVLSEKGLERMKGIQERVNSKFSWK